MILHKEAGTIPKSVRKVKRMSRALLARLIGVNQGNIPAYEAGSTRLGIAVAKRLGKAPHRQSRTVDHPQPESVDGSGAEAQ